MASISWWRSWHGAPTDLKWQVIALKANVKVGIVSAVAWALLDYASQHENRGTVDGFDTETYAVYSGFDEAEIIAVIKAMTDKGVIANGCLVSWDKRQPKSEEKIENVRQWRRKKEEDNERNQMLSDVTESYTDTDTDKDKDKYTTEISSTFTQATNITPYKLDQWDEASQTMCKAGVTPDNILAAVEKLNKSDMTITGLWSITKTAIAEHANPNGHKRRGMRGMEGLV